MTAQPSRAAGRRLTIVLVALLFLAVPAAFVLAQGPGGFSDAGAMVNVTAAGGDVRAAGANVVIRGTATSIEAAGALIDIRADTTGALLATGAQVSVEGNAGGDMTVAGAVVNARGRVGGSADVAGAVVRVDLATGGRLRVAGANVTVGSGTDVGGTLQVAGANVLVESHVAGPVEMSAAIVNFNGRADGNVTVGADTVIIGPQATIAGDLLLRTQAEPQIAAGAVITGAVRHIEPDQWWSQVPPWAWRVGLGAFIALGTIVAGLAMLAITGSGFSTAVGHARARPMSSILIGIVALIVIPVVAVLLMSLVIGLTVGLALLLVMPILFVFGHAVAAAGIAAGVFVRGNGRISGGQAFLMLVIGAILIAAVSFIPIAGPFVLLLTLLLGLGAVVRTVGWRLRQTEPQAP